MHFHVCMSVLSFLSITEEAVKEGGERLRNGEMRLIRNQQTELPKCIWCWPAGGHAEVGAIFLRQESLLVF